MESRRQLNTRAISLQSRGDRNDDAVAEIKAACLALDCVLLVDLHTYRNGEIRFADNHEFALSYFPYES